MIVKENCADPKTLLFVLEVLQYFVVSQLYLTDNRYEAYYTYV